MREDIHIFYFLNLNGLKPQHNARYNNLTLSVWIVHFLLSSKQSETWVFSDNIMEKFFCSVFFLSTVGSAKSMIQSKWAEALITSASIVLLIPLAGGGGKREGMVTRQFVTICGWIKEGGQLKHPHADMIKIRHIYLYKELQVQDIHKIYV